MSSTAEWLDQSLHSPINGTELAYDADVKWTVRQHLLDLVSVTCQVPSLRTTGSRISLGKFEAILCLQAFPTLTLKVQTYTHNTGR